MTELVNIQNKLCIPHKSRLNTKIPFNQIFKAALMSAKEQKDFSADTAKIYIAGEINQNNSNWQPVQNEEYNYTAIQYIFAELKRNNNTERTDEILHKLFQNPVIIIYSFNNKLAYSSAFKRLNKTDNSKSVAESIYNTSFDVEQYFYDKISQIMTDGKIKTLYDLYKHIDDTVYLQMLYKITKKFTYTLSVEELKKMYKEIDVINKENRKLKVLYNNTYKQADKMNLFMQIKKNEQKINEKYKIIQE